MNTALWAWAVSAIVLLGLAVVLGSLVRPTGGPLGILIDSRGRFSLTHLQVVIWSIVVLSLISGVFWGRLVAGAADPLSFSIPDQVLGLLGISVGSAMGVSAVKSAKDVRAPEQIATSARGYRPRLGQIFLLEEGEYADRVVDIAKFQNLALTVVLAVAYVVLAAHALHDAKSAAGLSALPVFSGTFLTLLGISHAAHLAGKLPGQAVVAKDLPQSPAPDPATPSAEKSA
jgi:hypothetical protein